MSVSTTTTFALEVTDDPAALVRVLVTLQRRQCRITAVEVDRGDRHRPGRPLVRRPAPPGGRRRASPRAPRAQPRRAAAWLANLVDVLDVAEPAAGAGAQRSLS